MDYKKHYTVEELNDIISWFSIHKDHLPQSLQLDKATYIMDLKNTMVHFLDIIKKHKDNPTYAAQIYILFLIREAVRKKWTLENKEYE